MTFGLVKNILLVQENSGEKKEDTDMRRRKVNEYTVYIYEKGYPDNPIDEYPAKAYNKKDAEKGVLKRFGFNPNIVRAEAKRTTYKNLTNEKVRSVLNDLGYYTHYLKYKKTSDWDKYDKSNWNSIYEKEIKMTKYE